MTALDAPVLLQQIKSEPLSSLLSSLRRPVSLPAPLATLFPTPSSPQIIEVHSPSHTGKTSFLYYCIAQVVLPEWFPRYPVRLCTGGGRAVVVLDCENRFDGTRLRDVMGDYVRDKLNDNVQGGFIHSQPLAGPRDEEIDMVLQNALSRVYIFKPTSGMSLLATVKGLKDTLSEEEYHHITLGLVCIDSLTSFHHVLRGTSYLQQYYSTLSTSLRDFSTLFSIPILVTSWSLFPQSPDIGIPGGARYIGTGPSHDIYRRPIWRQYFPHEWSRGVDKRIILMKREVRGFMMGISIEEAEKDKERREEVVRRGEVVGWVEGEGTEFEMYITDKGIKVRV